MQRKARLAALIAGLSTGRAVLIEDLRWAHGGHVDSDLADLVVAGWPVEGDGTVGFRIVRTQRLPEMVLDEADMDALRAGAAQIALRDPGVAARLSAILAAAVSDWLPGMDLDSITADVLDPDVIENARYLPRLRRAIRARLRVTLDYADAKGRATRRDVRPLDLERWGVTWALIAWCEMRGDFRQFRLDRIADAVVRDAFADDPACGLAMFRIYHRAED